MSDVLQTREPEIKRLCKQCFTSDGAKMSRRFLRYLAAESFVSPTGTAHQPHRRRLNETFCGRDAQGFWRGERT